MFVRRITTASIEIVGYVVKPEQLSPTSTQPQAFTVPAGFSISVFAEGLGKPRMLELADDGRVYVTRREPGDVVVLRDTNGDGRSDDMRTAVRRPMLHGIAIDGRRVHFVSVKDVFSADITSDGTFDNVTRIVDDFPEGGQHPNRTIRLGPDKHLYAFVAMHGSWNRGTPSGYEVVRIRFQKGTPTSIEPFLTGFLTTAGGRPAMYGRPVGLAVAQDGALLVADDAGGRIYRIAHGDRTTRSARPAMEPQAPAVGTSGTRDEDSGGVIAMERTETRAEAALSVTSPAFQPGAAKPTPYSGYGERFSPPLRWSNAPAGSKSFALLMGDPDAKMPKPYVHWLLHNVPADATQLPESVPTPPRLKDPKGPSRDEIRAARSNMWDRGHPKAIPRTTITFRCLRSISCSTYRQAPIAKTF